jgi:hypothetical protein
MPIVLVQKVTGSGATLVLNGVAAGNLLTLQDSYFRTTQTGVGETVPTDSQGTWSAASADAPATSAGTDDTGCGVFYQANVAAGTHTVTPQANPFKNATLCEWSGLVTSNVLDVAVSAKTSQGSQTSQTTGVTGVTAQAEELVLITLGSGCGAGVADVGFTDPVTGFTTLQKASDTSASVGAFHAYKPGSFTGTQQAKFNWTDSEANQGSHAAIVTFRAVVARVPPYGTTGAGRLRARQTYDLTAAGWFSTGVEAARLWDRDFIVNPGSPGEISGTATITFAQTGTLNGAGALAATAPVVFGQTGTLQGTGALAGSAGAVFGQTGAIAGAGALAGTAPIIFGQTGAVVGSGAMAGTAPLIFGQTGSLAGSGALAGSTPVVFGQTGDLQNLSGSGAMTGAADLIFGQTGSLAGAGALAGLGAITFAQTGTMAGAGALTGTTALVFGQTGAIGGSGALAGSTAIVFSQAGALTGAGALSGSAPVVFGGTATADTPSGAIAGTAALLFGQTGTLIGSGSLNQGGGGGLYKQRKKTLKELREELAASQAHHPDDLGKRLYGVPVPAPQVNPAPPVTEAPPLKKRSPRTVVLPPVAPPKKLPHAPAVTYVVTLAPKVQVQMLLFEPAPLFEKAPLTLQRSHTLQLMRTTCPTCGRPH